MYKMNKIKEIIEGLNSIENIEKKGINKENFYI